MKKVGGFELYLDETSLNDDGSRKQISVEVQVGTENTAVLLNCECCEELLSSRLPGGVLIPIASTLKSLFKSKIASTLKSLFKSKGMRNIDVETTGTLMTRVYRGVIKKPFVSEMKQNLEIAVNKFSKKRRS
ncbi:MAG: hypothetical protein ACXADL_16615 [Candidatus Thorarchaeota archaeon]|jgi:hypothetical protein